MDRRERIQLLADHARNPRHFGATEGADVVMPGGGPECGGRATVYLKGDGDSIQALSFTGDGDTISVGAASIALERVHDEGLGMEEVLSMDYEAFMDSLGRDIVGSRTRNATLGLSTLKNAVRKYRRDRLRAGSGRGRISETA